MWWIRPRGVGGGKERWPFVDEKSGPSSLDGRSSVISVGPSQTSSPPDEY